MTSVGAHPTGNLEAFRHGVGGKTSAAPASLAMATAISPIGPQPVTTTFWPAISSTKAAWTALPIGSCNAATSGVSPSLTQRWSPG